MRTKATIKRLKLYNTRPTRNYRGQLMHGTLMSHDTSHNTRIQPDRRWFENTRVVGQKQLEKFKEDLNKAIKSPNMMVMKQNKLPLSLLIEPKVHSTFLFD
jgi:nuclear GTP-binding protein